MSPYYIRGALAISGIVTLIVMWGFNEVSTPNGTDVGAELFWKLFLIMFSFVSLEGIRSTVFSVVDERKEGTLNLLFLTNVRSEGVLFGKIGGSLLSGFFYLFAVVPVLMVPLIAGGVTLSAFLAAACVLINTLLLSIACGTLASTLARSGMAAIAGGFGLLTLVWFLPAVAVSLIQGDDDSIPLLSSFGNLLGCFRAVSYSLGGNGPLPKLFWVGQFIAAALSAFLFLGAARMLSRNWTQGMLEGIAVGRRRARNIDDLLNGIGRRFKALENLVPASANPLSRALALRLGINRWLPVLMLLTALPPIVGAFIGSDPDFQIGPLIRRFLESGSSLLFSYICVQALADAKASGEMEILMTTPLPNSEIIGNLWYLLRRMIGWSTATLVAAQMAATVLAMGYGRWHIPFSTQPIVQEISTILTSILVSALGIYATAWMGMWWGHRSRKIGNAVMTVFLVTGVLPMVLNYAMPALITFLFGPFEPSSNWGWRSSSYEWPRLIPFFLTAGLNCIWFLVLIGTAKSKLAQNLRNSTCN